MGNPMGRWVKSSFGGLLFPPTLPPKTRINQWFLFRCNNVLYIISFFLLVSSASVSLTGFFFWVITGRLLRRPIRTQNMRESC